MAEIDGPDGSTPIPAPMQGTIISLSVDEGDTVHHGQAILVMEAMKMQHEITATVGGIVRSITVMVGDTVFEDHPLLFIEETADASGG
ncbi:MAG: acetyl-CoA carboxylase biotin carboxyl carrier protein subunit, partial [Gammaproteobacteria bacterium]|nr:acetyl-CoA carboxylase biotin carboxyl carrier protein subunit [Gammaproteobacteria bacterium]